ncbi:MAG: YpsA SLOG family protein, partial [Thermodesulfobacteriota bacterium]
MIRRIISGGQSGVERAALDVAHRLFMDYGGWVAGWLAEEDESLIQTYRLHILR